MDVSLMITCLGDVIRPDAGVATVNLLERLGHHVHFPTEQTCCGQPFYNSGVFEEARKLAKHTIAAFQDPRPVVVPSGSCAAMVKLEFPHLLAEDHEWHARAKELAARTWELSDFLVNHLKVTDVGARFPGKVTYHYACHLRGMGLKSEVVTLLNNVRDLEYIPLTSLDQCCGFGGSFSVRYPDISGAMVGDKLRYLQETGADVVVSTDTGCLMNIGGACHRQDLPIRIMHLAELLDSH